MTDLVERLKASAPLVDRLNGIPDRIGVMCSKGHPPRMSIPVDYDDDDIFITNTAKEAADEIQTLRDKLAETEEALKLSGRVSIRATEEIVEQSETIERLRGAGQIALQRFVLMAAQDFEIEVNGVKPLIGAHELSQALEQGDG